VKIVGINTMDNTLISLYDGPVAIIDIMSTSDVRISLTYFESPATHCLVPFPEFQFSKYKCVAV
jgi:hypothetical protein